MSLNIGTAAVEAAKALSHDPRWLAIREGLREEMRKHMNLALDSAPEHRHASVGYARACRDMWVAWESATFGKAPNQTKAPAPKGEV
jgi:hypothetical protein